MIDARTVVGLLESKRFIDTLIERSRSAEGSAERRVQANMALMHISGVNAVFDGSLPDSALVAIAVLQVRFTEYLDACGEDPTTYLPR